ncbi:MAG: 3-methyl-2-oxobutanoate dehydrogenase subunit VorB [Firmicutes bacterium]|nr:3-methyl-2-oxobutanoate dehydrogenase subunit VorB [Bacillota bacterium]
MKGNEAMCEAAIQAGCRYFFGYPITPASEQAEYMARRLYEEGGVYLQAESEVAAANMVLGAAGAGARVMTATSGPGFSLMQEAVSAIAGSEIPSLFVNISRGGPGTGNIGPSQADYFQACKGGGHGDYRNIVLAPSSVQEAADLIFDGFDLADRYRMAVVVLADGFLGQMMEPVEFRRRDVSSLPEKPWAATGAKGRPKNIINSYWLKEEVLEALNERLQAKYRDVAAKEKRWEEYLVDDADIVLVAYGTVGRISRSVVEAAREEGIRAGLVRPITLWPFPDEPISRLAGKTKAFLVVEMSAGQMLEDVRLAGCDKSPVYFNGRMGGMIQYPDEILREVEKIADSLGVSWR